MDPYVLLSPIGATREYALDWFLDGVKQISPDYIVFAVDEDAPLSLKSAVRDAANEVLTVPAVDRPGLLSRISAARELLREWFLRSKYSYSLWLDSDIVVPRELPGALWKIAETLGYVVVVHCYPGRPSTVVWHGSGIMLVHKFGAELGRFIVTSVNGMHISEDFNFFSLVSGAESIARQYHGRGGVLKVCIFPDVKHMVEPGNVVTVPADRTRPLDWWLDAFGGRH